MSNNETTKFSTHMPPRCEYCRFWQESRVNSNDGQCRKPLPSVREIKNGGCPWPIVNCDDWCSHWERDHS